MKLKTKAVAYGVAGLALAGIIIISGSAAGLLTSGPLGVLSILFTDPPTVPNGVSAVYITYSDLAVHATGFGNSSGWVVVKGEGTFDSMKLVNLSQTISSASIPALSYNLVRFNISGVEVDYLGSNYSATIGSGMLTVPIVGGLKVNSSSPAATLVDIQPTVLNLGEGQTPRFTIAAGAKALQVPSGAVDASVKQVGHTFSLQGHDWFETFRSDHTERLNSSAPTLTASSLSFSATNDGSDPLVIRMVVVTPGTAGDGENGALGSVTRGAIFSVASDGSLALLNGSPSMVSPLLEGSGFTLAPGATHQFSFSGAISTLVGNESITAGTTYYILVIGSEAVNVQSVVAS